MNHPHIARVLDAGFTKNSMPYVAMELVEGEPITDYCERMELPIEARLGLFTDVCEAVQHAHQKGVIHRDLKPTNVLVSDVHGRPRVKVIDFGLAKAMDDSFASDGTLTVAGQILGTPAYMSPEQAHGRRRRCDGRRLRPGCPWLRVGHGQRPVRAATLGASAVPRSTRQGPEGGAVASERAR